MSSDDDTGGPSELGTKEYWDRSYDLEIANFNSHGDVGEEWFGEDSALRIVRWLDRSVEVRKNASIVDLGTGNGMLLASLAREGFSHLLGLDYSPTAVQLAREVAKKMDLDIKFQEWDALGVAACPGAPHDVALDKGTYDAVGLNQDGATARRKYAERVKQLLRPGGLLLLTSCNWTRSELETHFAIVGFAVESQLPTPTFRFGGSEGSLVTALVFRRSL